MADEPCEVKEIVKRDLDFILKPVFGSLRAIPQPKSRDGLASEAKPQPKNRTTGKSKLMILQVLRCMAYVCEGVTLNWKPG